VEVLLNLHEQGIIYNEMRRAAREKAAAREYLAAARERFEDSLAIKRKIGNEGGIANSLGELGKLWMDAGQTERAIAAFTEARDIFTRLGTPAKVALTIEDLARVHELQGHLPRALEMYRQALGLFEQYAPAEVERCKHNITLVEKKLRG
jgi:tetratricopeptide (TPR) repeat protein